MQNVWRIASWQRQFAARGNETTSLALIQVEAPFSAVTLVLIAASGYRVEGLSVAQLVAVLRELA